MRLGVALGAAVFATFVLAAFPSKTPAFRDGLSSLRTQISIATVCVPIVIDFPSRAPTLLIAAPIATTFSLPIRRSGFRSTVEPVEIPFATTPE
jgi:hypothetical protein